MSSKYQNKQKKKAQIKGQNQNALPAVSQPAAVSPPSSMSHASAIVQSASALGSAQPLRRKDQERAIWAYECAKAAGDGVKEYEITVQTFAATVLRSGLAVAVSVLQRDAQRPGPKRLMADLAANPVPGIPEGPNGWPERVRNIQALDDYMLASRELLALITWLRRACRAVRASKESRPKPEEGVHA